MTDQVPIRKVVRIEVSSTGAEVEILECGHKGMQLRMPTSPQRFRHPAETRRCLRCAPEGTS